MPGLSSSWRIRDIEIPSRIVLAPMAGVSVQAFRRQGRRFGAGLVCSEMVSACGLHHGNERTLGYLRIAPDEHPLAVQIFGSDPGPMADAARMVVDAGADIVGRVDVPVIASGDITDRDTAARVIEATGAAAVMVGRGAQGRPWALREMTGDGPAEAEDAEVVAELIRFMREVVREMDPDRAVGFLRKFYGWYLRGTPGARQIRGTLVTCPTVADAERALLDFCPAAEELLLAHETEIGL